MHHRTESDLCSSINFIKIFFSSSVPLETTESIQIVRTVGNTPSHCDHICTVEEREELTSVQMPLPSEASVK